MDRDLVETIEIIQYNCHIADARYAGDYTLCVYLLKMREMYRWEQGISFKTQLTTDDVGDWLTDREGLWDDVEEQDYKPISIEDKTFDPFDNELINTFLDKNNLVYNAGLGIRCRPHFFIGELESIIQHDDYTVYISGKEYARDMAAPAAMAQENKIFIRRESLRRVIWEILDDAHVAGLDNPLTRAMKFYSFDNNAEEALDKMTEAEIEYVIQHEIGEFQAGKIISDDWNDMLTKLSRTQAEIMLRAVRDHLADALTTLPMLLENKSDASIHFYFGNMTAMRKHLAPKLMDAYEIWHKTGKLDELQKMLSTSKFHWENLVKEVITLFSDTPNNEAVEILIKSRKL